jgi:hypothetical protein
MPLNKDGLEAGQPVDFDTMQKIKLKQREDQKNGQPEPKRRAAKTSSREGVRESRQRSVSSVPDSEEPKEAE